MVCSMLKYVKLFYLSLSTFRASSTLVNDKDGRPVAIHNMIRSPGQLDHRYTFVKNVSYAHCFRDSHAHSWIYKDAGSPQRMVSFASTLTPIKLKYSQTQSPTPTSRHSQLPPIKPITRSSRSPIRPNTPESSGSESE